MEQPRRGAHAQDLTTLGDEEMVLLATQHGHRPAEAALLLRYRDWSSGLIQWLGQRRGLTPTDLEDAEQDEVFGILKAIGRYDRRRGSRPGGCLCHTFLHRVLTDRFKDFVKHLRRLER